MNIKFLAMDVDGTLTDGKIYMGEGGELFKAFDVRDGCGIKEILPQYDILPIIITARESRILANRCRELGVSSLCQGKRDKLSALMEIITEYNHENRTEYGLEHCAYIGDDILDLTCIEPIKEAGGFTACPADAVERVKAAAEYVCIKRGGEGAVREVIENLILSECRGKRDDL